MAKNTRTLTRTIISFSLTAVFLYLAFRNTNLGDLWNSLKGANLWWTIALVPLGLFSHWVRAWRWQFLIGPIKKHASLKNLFSAVMIGYMVNNAIPRLGEIVRAYAISRQEGIPKGAALGTVVVERILDTFVFLLMLCAVLVLYPSGLDPFVPHAESLRGYFLAGSLALLILSAVFFFKSEALFGLMKFLKPIVPRRYAGRIDHIIESFLTGIGAGSARETLFIVTLLSLFLYFVYAMTLYAAFFTLEPIKAFHFDFGVAVVLLTITTVAYVLPAPGAMGTYHSFLTFSLVGIYRVDQTSALSFSIITHEVSYLTITVVGLWYFMKDHLRMAEITEQSAEEQEALTNEASNPTK